MRPFNVLCIRNDQHVCIIRWSADFNDVASIKNDNERKKNANSRSRRSFWLMIPLAWLVSPYLSHRTHKTVVLHSHPFTCIKPDPFAFSWVLKKQLDINTHKNLYLLAIYNLFLLNYCFNDFNGEFLSMKTRRWICNLLILTINFLTNKIFWNKNER